ncbi:alpha/beta fold hydrolase [Pseudomonas sp. PDM13]|uniref:alpha/beta fold hydrolase n=1 Tax=Pseudomonas sp. PDM13 TaxID=2769255 RepID=UPI0021E04A1C|nr:alpha/beta hydrolase [Pseudomonas sp. PDM13]MCU9948315.1 alpha/beta hydrolase [Pseudomonas sp. PDM13]
MPKPSTLQLRRLRAALLLFGMAACGACQTSAPGEALQRLAHERGASLQDLATAPFPLRLGIPAQLPASARLRLYIEGDGHAWATASQPSLDPSPRDLLVVRLAFADPAPSLYLARPCQFIRVDACQPALWTDRRYAPEILASLDQALDLIKARFGNQEFELVGYSGGAALALLLASQRDDIAQVQTLAGNLSPRQWVRLKGLSPLQGSLEPLDAPQRLARVPQRHFSGSLDPVVPPQLARDYAASLPGAECLQRVELAGVDHHSGWEQAWALWRGRSIDCASPSDGTARAIP